jgi:hypothetical protein
LKKAVTDSTLQIAKETQSLTQQVSSDFAIVFGAVLIRHSGIIAGTLKGNAALLAYLFVVIFIIARMYFSLQNASVSVTNQRDARKAWNNKVHFYLTKTDFEELALKPIGAAESAFYNTRRIIVAAYFVLIALLTATWTGLHIGTFLQKLIELFTSGCGVRGDWIVT